MKKLFILILVLVAFSFSGCTNRKDAENALKNQGFTDIQIKGYNFFVCAEKDFYSTGFSAVNPQGKRVQGTVCSGLIFKGSTIRW